ncbi:Glucose-1-phosphate adenylyltransferase large subunit 2, chloroplastic, partial [Ananas comosus]
MAGSLQMPSSLSLRSDRRSSPSSSSSSLFGRRIGSIAHCGETRSSRRRTDVGFAPVRATINSVLNDVAKDFVPKRPLRAPMTEKPLADPKSVASIILGGGAGTRLFPLTQKRAKPAVPIGGCYRLIDVPMSNCINSAINKIYILTQFNSQSLNRHLARTYDFANGVNFGDGFVEVLAATQTPGEFGKRWFQGTADAVRQFIWIFGDAKLRHIENILILSGDHLYRMDYMDFVQKHMDSGADISVSCVPMDDSRASDFGLMKIDNAGRITQFLEKPKGKSLETMVCTFSLEPNACGLKQAESESSLLQQVDTTILGLSPQNARKYNYIASMGIYIFRTDVLLKRYPTAMILIRDYSMASNDYNVQDIGTIKSFFDANLALTDEKWQIFLTFDSVMKNPSRESIISHGCFLMECSVEHSIIGVRSRLECGVKLENTMMMGADYYQTEAERAACLAKGKVPVGVGENTKI